MVELYVEASMRNTKQIYIYIYLYNKYIYIYIYKHMPGCKLKEIYAYMLLLV